MMENVLARRDLGGTTVRSQFAVHWPRGKIENCEGVVTVTAQKDGRAQTATCASRIRLAIR